MSLLLLSVIDEFCTQMQLSRTEIVAVGQSTEGTSEEEYVGLSQRSLSQLDAQVQNKRRRKVS